MLEIVQVADGIQLLMDLLGDLAGAAGANLETAKVGVTDRKVAAQVAQPVAIGAIDITGQVSRGEILDLTYLIGIIFPTLDIFAELLQG